MTTLAVRLPDPLRVALDRAVAKHMTSNSEYCRQALLERLRKDGIEPNAGREAA